MAEPDPQLIKVAIVWRGDAQARVEARPETSRFNAVFEALARCGIAAEPAVWSEDLIGEVRAQLLLMDGVLVWVDPIATATGERRDALDDLLREVARAGVFVSAHPDVAAGMGAKSVLYRTRELGWGADTHFYENRDDFAAAFPSRLMSGARVLKQNRGNGGIGVKVARDSGADEGLNTLSAFRPTHPMIRRDPSSVSLRLTPSPAGGEGTFKCGYPR